VPGPGGGGVAAPAPTTAAAFVPGPGGGGTSGTFVPSFGGGAVATDPAAPVQPKTTAAAFVPSFGGGSAAGGAGGGSTAFVPAPGGGTFVPGPGGGGLATLPGLNGEEETERQRRVRIAPLSKVIGGSRIEGYMSIYGNNSNNTSIAPLSKATTPVPRDATTHAPTRSQARRRGHDAICLDHTLQCVSPSPLSSDRPQHCSHTRNTRNEHQPGTNGVRWRLCCRLWTLKEKEDQAGTHLSGTVF